MTQHAEASAPGRPRITSTRSGRHRRLVAAAMAIVLAFLVATSVLSWMQSVVESMAAWLTLLGAVTYTVRRRLRVGKRGA